MNLTHFFRCPKCKGGLVASGSAYRCNHCHKDYPIRSGVPVFLTGELESDEYSKFWDNGWQNRRAGGDHSFQDMDADALRKTIKERLEVANIQKAPVSSAVFSKDEIVLNIGCGLNEASGFTVRGANNYIGLDFSFNAAKYSLESIRKLAGDGVTVQANAEELPIESNSIDLVYSNGVIHHTPNTLVAIGEVFRVMKPTGRGVIGLYSTYSPTFLVARIVGYLKSIFNRKVRNWYGVTETAWSVEDSQNPWTKTYTKTEIRAMFDREDCRNLKIRSTGFLWGNVVPVLGKYFANTRLGEITAAYFRNKLGSMWVITFEKYPPRNGVGMAELPRNSSVP